MHSLHSIFCGSSNCNIRSKKKWHDLPNLEDMHMKIVQEKITYKNTTFLQKGMVNFSMHHNKIVNCIARLSVLLKKLCRRINKCHFLNLFE